MYSRKRQAPESLSPTRSPKQPRLSLEIIDSNWSEPKDIQTRWINLAKDIGGLIMDTVVAVLPASILPSPTRSTPPLVDEATSSSSPTSSLPIATPRQTPSPQRRPDIHVDHTSTPKQDSVFTIRSPPLTRDTDIGTHSPQNPALDEVAFPIFDDANISTPKFQPARSSNRDRWTTPRDPSPNYRLKHDVLHSMGSLHLRDSCDSSTQPSELSSSSNAFPVPKSGGHRSKKTANRSHHRPLNKKREHIYAKVHRAYVLRDRLALREELTQRLYQKRREQGFKSTYTDFKDLLQYQRTLDDLAVSPPPSSPPVSFGPHSGHRKDDTDEEFLRRALNIFDTTIKSPQAPKPNIPAKEELDRIRRERQADIDRRLRPPALPSSLSSDQEKQVSELLHKRGVISKFAREQVSDQDISRLRPGQWLNDEIINFYGAMILARSEGSKENPSTLAKSKSKKKTPLNVHYFSSFFWSKLTQEGYDKGRLAKWTKKIDIFSKDAVIMPVNHGNAHWTAAAINFRQKRFESYDSMNMAKSKVFQVLRSYVNSEHMNKKNKPFNFDDWQDWAPATTPQQENGYDCGVFTCQFLETISRGEDFFNFSQENMHYLRKRMIWEIGNTKLFDS